MNEGWYWRRPGGDAEDSLEGSEHSQLLKRESSESSAESSGSGNARNGLGWMPEESMKGAKGARSENTHPSHSSALPSDQQMPEGVQKSSKVSIQNDGHLREKLDTFGTATEQARPTGRNEETF